MKTKKDLEALYPEIIAAFKNRGGDDVHDEGTDEYGDPYPTGNLFYFKKDGWDIEIGYGIYGNYDYEPATYYQPSGSTLKSASGSVGSIIVYGDEDTDDEVSYELDCNDPLWCALDKELEEVTV